MKINKNNIKIIINIIAIASIVAVAVMIGGMQAHAEENNKCQISVGGMNFNAIGADRDTDGVYEVELFSLVDDSVFTMPIKDYFYVYTFSAKHCKEVEYSVIASSPNKVEITHKNNIQKIVHGKKELTDLEFSIKGKEVGKTDITVKVVGTDEDGKTASATGTFKVDVLPKTCNIFEWDEDQKGAYDTTVTMNIGQTNKFLGHAFFPQNKKECRTQVFGGRKNGNYPNDATFTVKSVSPTGIISTAVNTGTGLGSVISITGVKGGDVDVTVTATVGTKSMDRTVRMKVNKCDIAKNTGKATKISVTPEQETTLDLSEYFLFILCGPTGSASYGVSGVDTEGYISTAMNGSVLTITGKKVGTDTITATTTVGGETSSVDIVVEVKDTTQVLEEENKQVGTDVPQEIGEEEEKEEEEQDLTDSSTPLTGHSRDSNNAESTLDTESENKNSRSNGDTGVIQPGTITCQVAERESCGVVNQEGRRAANIALPVSDNAVKFYSELVSLRYWDDYGSQFK